MALSVIILAAGQGKRMKSDLPKVLQPLAGEPLLSHVLTAARSLQPAAIHVVYGHGGDVVRKAMTAAPTVTFASTFDAEVGARAAGNDGQQIAPGGSPVGAGQGRDVGASEQPYLSGRPEMCPLQWALQAEQLGTGHAVMQAIPAVPDDHTVLILYGDVPLIRRDTLQQLISRVSKGALGLLTVILRDPAGYGRVVRDAGGSVVRIVEHKDASPRERAITEGNTGVLAAQAGQLRQWLDRLRNDNAQGEYYLTDVVSLAVKDGLRIEAVVAATEPEVLGVNDKVQLAEVERALRTERAQQLMLQGATIADPARLDIRGSVAVGRDVFIDVNAVFTGQVTLGDRVRIGPNCCVKDAHIGADTEVLANSIIDDAIVGAHCVIGPFGRLRPGTRLHDEVHIGNFVEVKKSELRQGSKANHLTYIGDASIGRKVNVGAGTVTVNYDGVNKWPTEVGDGAFIGSGTMLVAPVKVGANANTGAGSTITANVPEGKLALARARQVLIEGWERPKQTKPVEGK